jgi:hypothetical protein
MLVPRPILKEQAMMPVSKEKPDRAYSRQPCRPLSPAYVDLFPSFLDGPNAPSPATSSEMVSIYLRLPNGLSDSKCDKSKPFEASICYIRCLRTPWRSVSNNRPPTLHWGMSPGSKFALDPVDIPRIEKCCRVIRLGGPVASHCSTW